MRSEHLHINLFEPWLLLDNVFFHVPFHTKLHRHSAWQLSASLQGSFCYGIDGQKVLTAPGEWILLSPNLPHDVSSESQTSAALQIFFRKFPENLFPEPAKLLNLKHNIWRTGKISLNTLNQLNADIHKYNAGDHKTPFPMCCIIQATQYFVMKCIENMPIDDLTTQLPNPKLLAVIKYMEENYNLAVGIPEFANIAHLSKKRFNDLFKKELNDTPMHFFNNIRLGYAQEMLLRGLSVKETANACGFATVQYFCRFFMKCMNTSPAKFQRTSIYDAIN